MRIDWGSPQADSRTYLKWGNNPGQEPGKWTLEANHDCNPVSALADATAFTSTIGPTSLRAGNNYLAVGSVSGGLVGLPICGLRVGKI